MGTIPQTISITFYITINKKYSFSTPNIETITIVSEAASVYFVTVAILILQLDILFIAYKTKVTGLHLPLSWQGSTNKL